MEPDLIPSAPAGSMAALHVDSEPVAIRRSEGRLDVTLDTAPLVRKLAFLCLGTIAALLVLDYVFTFRKVIDDDSIGKITNIAREESIPTWFSATQALCAGLTAFACVWVLRLRGAARSTLAGWLVLGLFFVWMAVDDSAVFHERVGSALGRAFRDDPSAAPPGVRWLLELPTYSWQIFIAPLFAAMGIFILTFLWRQLGRFRMRRWLVAALALYATAMAIDWMEGVDDLYENTAARLGFEDYTVSHYFKVTEETLEMLGTTTFLVTFLRFLTRQTVGLRVLIKGPPAA